MTACPHRNVVFCPLYVAAHRGDWFGCDDGQLGGWDGCAVNRGFDYAQELGRLRAVDPRFVAEIEWEESAASAKAQRDRNMRSAGVH